MARGTRNPEDVAREFGDMYLNKNMTAGEIAIETGYSVNTVKLYLQKYGYTLKHRRNREIKEHKRKFVTPPSKRRKPKPKQTSYNNDLKEEFTPYTGKKPYMELDDKHVIYRGAVYEKLNRDELYDLLMMDHGKK